MNSTIVKPNDPTSECFCEYLVTQGARACRSCKKKGLRSTRQAINKVFRITPFSLTVEHIFAFTKAIELYFNSLRVLSKRVSPDERAKITGILMEQHNMFASNIDNFRKVRKTINKLSRITPFCGAVEAIYAFDDEIEWYFNRLRVLSKKVSPDERAEITGFLMKQHNMFESKINEFNQRN